MPIRQPLPNTLPGTKCPSGKQLLSASCEVIVLHSLSICTRGPLRRGTHSNGQRWWRISPDLSSRLSEESRASICIARVKPRQLMFLAHVTRLYAAVLNAKTHSHLVVCLSEVSLPSETPSLFQKYKSHSILCPHQSQTRRLSTAHLWRVDTAIIWDCVFVMQ